MLPFLLASLAVVAVGSDDSMSLIIGRQSGYILLPPKVVCTGNVNDMKWSDDGRYLVVSRTVEGLTKPIVKQMVEQMVNPNPNGNPTMVDFSQHSLVVWDNVKGQASNVWGSKTPDASCAQFVLVGNTYYFIAVRSIADNTQGNTSEFSLFRGQLGTTSTRLLRTEIPGTVISIAATDPKTKTILVCTQEDSMRYMVSGNTITPIENLNQLPFGLAANYLPNRSKAGIVPPPGKVESPTVVLSEPREPEPEEIVLRTAPISTGSKAARIFTIALVYNDPENPDKQSGVIAVGVGSKYDLAGNLSALSYSISNVVVVRDLVPAPLEVLKNAKKAAQKAALLSNVKQIGTALLMWAADSDSIVPGGTLPDTISAYLMNNQILDGFVYTFSGGNIDTLDNPVGTELGYIEGEDGRAVVYADGHAKWVSDK